MLKTEENKWTGEEMKPYSNFQPKHITDQDKHIFSVWEWHCLSAVVTHPFLLWFPTGSVLGQQSAPLSPSLTQDQLLRCQGFHSRRSQAAWAGGCQEQQSHPSSCATSQALACLEAELATALLSLLTLQEPSPPTLLFLTQTGALIRFTPWPPASANRNRLWNCRVNSSFFRLPKALLSLGSWTPSAGNIPPITWKVAPAFFSAGAMRTGPYCLCPGLGKKLGTMYLGFREKLSDPPAQS